MVQLSTQRLSEGELKLPIAVIEKVSPHRVKGLNQAAEDSGLCIGQTATRASISTPTLKCIFWDEARIARANQNLVNALLHAGPRVVPVDGHTGAYWLDARGMSHLGGEEAFAERITAIGAEQGYPQIRVGIANTSQTAFAAAMQASIKQPIVIIPPKSDESFRTQLPLQFLPISHEVQDTLLGLGVTHTEQLKTLSAAHLEARFGAEGLQAWRAAHGEDYRRVDARVDPDLCRSTLCLDMPVDAAPALIFGIKHLSMDLAERLKEQCRSASALKLTLSLDDRSEHEEVLHPARPVQNGLSIFELVRDRLEHLSQPLSSPIVELNLVAWETVPADPEQVHMGQHRWDPQSVENALDRLQGRFGQPVIFEAHARAEYRPEYAGEWRAIHTVPIHSLSEQPISHSPLKLAPLRRQLHSPLPVHVRTDDDGRPITIRWSTEWVPIESRGPERISGAWWQSVPYAYEDYSIILPSEEVLWLRYDAVHRLWTLNGWFD